MASVGLSEAAKLTGRNQTTIHRAMKTGRLSYTKDEAGGRRIDTAELDRVFGIKSSLAADLQHGNGADAPAMAQPVQSHVTPVREVELLRAWLVDRDETIRDLRARLDAADQRLTALLARPEPALPPEPDPPRPLGRRILAWLARQHGW